MTASAAGSGGKPTRSSSKSVAAAPVQPRKIKRTVISIRHNWRDRAHMIAFNGVTTDSAGLVVGVEAIAQFVAGGADPSDPVMRVSAITINN